MQRKRPSVVLVLVLALLLLATYWYPLDELIELWSRKDSYYSHGFLVPFIAAFLIWRQRERLLKEQGGASIWGYPLVAGSCVLLLTGAFLSFRVLGQLSLVPMLAGLILLFWGSGVLWKVWFPLAFLLFMIPIPTSITQSFTLELKLFAAQSAVMLGRLLAFPIVQDGSYLYVAEEQLLVGDVCGGMRSLIALVALGALMSHLSKTRRWAKLTLFAASVPIAVFANAVRILILCIIAFYYGASAAAGLVHDVTGILIYAIAFACLFTLDGILRRAASAPSRDEAAS